jgi:hypothetical protein
MAAKIIDGNRLAQNPISAYKDKAIAVDARIILEGQS